MAEHRLLLRDIEIPDIDGIEVYVAHGGYQGAARALKMAPPQLGQEVEASGLRGRGGGWEPVADKWRRLSQSATTSSARLARRSRRTLTGSAISTAS